MELNRAKVPGCILALAALALACAWNPGRAAESSCPSPAPIHTFSSTGIYADRKGSLIDPTKVATNDQTMRPVREYIYKVTSHADRALETGDAAAGRCAAQLLESWARANALSGPSDSHETVYYKTDFIFALAGAEHKLSAHDRRLRSPTVVAWLKRLAVKNIADFPRRHPPTGNLYYWTGAMAAATGSLDGDASLGGYADKVFRSAMGEIGPDGVLQTELSRGGRALGYHLFALKALLFNQLYRTGCFARTCSPAPLQRLIDFDEAAVIDNAPLAKRAGAAQQKPESNLLIELCHLPDRARARTSRLQCDVRPIDNLVGGNMLLTIRAAKAASSRR